MYVCVCMCVCVCVLHRDRPYSYHGPTSLKVCYRSTSSVIREQSDDDNLHSRIAVRKNKCGSQFVLDQTYILVITLFELD